MDRSSTRTTFLVDSPELGWQTVAVVPRFCNTLYFPLYGCASSSTVAQLFSPSFI